MKGAITKFVPNEEKFPGSGFQPDKSGNETNPEEM